MNTNEPKSGQMPFDIPPTAIPLAIPVSKPRLPLVELIVGVACAWGMDAIVAGVVGVATFVAITSQASSAEYAGLPPINPILVFTLSACSGLFAAAVSWYMLCHRHRKGLIEGLRMHVGEPAWLGLGLVVGIAVPIVLYALPEPEGGNSIMAQFVMSDEGFYAVAVFALIAPLLEEVYYRGFLFTYLREYLGGVGAVAIVSFWFGAAHCPQLAGDWLMLLIVAAMGTFWTYMRHASGSLLPGLVSHWMYNALLVGPGLFLQ